MAATIPWAGCGLELYHGGGFEADGSVGLVTAALQSSSKGLCKANGRNGMPSNRISKTISAGNSPRDWIENGVWLLRLEAGRSCPPHDTLNNLYPSQFQHADLLMTSLDTHRPTTWHHSSQRPEGQIGFPMAARTNRPDTAQWGVPSTVDHNQFPGATNAVIVSGFRGNLARFTDVAPPASLRLR